MTERRVDSWLEEGGRLVRVRLRAPPGNVLGAGVLEEATRAFAAAPAGALGALLDHDGPSFCYGTDVREHGPGVMEGALPAFHELLRRVARFPVPVACVVRGRCLGGGLELACAADVIFAGADATFAQPEVKLAAFAPAGSAFLRARIGEGNARDLLLSGRPVRADEALRMGLVQSVDDEPEVAALAWLRDHVLRLSPSALRVAVRAARWGFERHALSALDDMERLYLEELLPLADAAEGVKAFQEKRPPRWASAGTSEKPR